MTDSELLSVIVVTYNSALVIRECLQELVAGISNRNVEFIVVDNNSTDETIRIVESVSEDIRVISSDVNSGFSKAVNIGARKAKGSLILLLNPDAKISPESLAELREASNLAGLAILAPLIVHPGGRLRVVSAGLFPSAWRMFCHYSGLSRLGGLSTAFRGHYLLPSQLGPEVETDWVTGACMLIPRPVWDQLGGLSEQWFMYAEDIDFCWRAHQQNYPVILMARIVATHAVGESTDQPKSMNADWITNLFDFYKSEMQESIFARRIWKITVVLGLLSRSVGYRFLAAQAKTEDERQSWKQESRRFERFSRTLFRVPS